MKILAVSGSPRGKNGNTERILRPFLEGAGKAGAETETVYLKEKSIKHCTGCYSCWTKTPGVCIHKDDMPELLEKIRHADVMVFVTPLYVHTVSGLMKDFMDRLLPLVKPFLEKRGEGYAHPGRNENVLRKMVLISTCGFPGRNQFSGLVETFRVFASGNGIDLSLILCTQGELLRQKELAEGLDWYFDAAGQAGEELVKTGRISAKTQEILDRELMDPELFMSTANMFWHSEIQDKKQSSGAVCGDGDLSEALSVPVDSDALPSNIQQAITGQPAVFNPGAAGDLRADIQFVLSGQEPGEYVLRIRGGRCTAHRGKVKNPVLTIISPSEVWLQIARGELSGQTAFMKGLYRTEGDLGLLMRMGELFSMKNKAG